MSKKARPSHKCPDKEKHPQLYAIAKKSGRSNHVLKLGIFGTMVTEKVYRAQINNKNKAREKQGLGPIEQS
jgi:hypothetical protein